MIQVYDLACVKWIYKQPDLVTLRVSFLCDLCANKFFFSCQSALYQILDQTNFPLPKKKYKKWHENFTRRMQRQISRGKRNNQQTWRWIIGNYLIRGEKRSERRIHSKLSAWRFRLGDSIITLLTQTCSVFFIIDFIV